MEMPVQWRPLVPMAPSSWSRTRRPVGVCPGGIYPGAHGAQARPAPARFVRPGWEVDVALPHWPRGAPKVDSETRLPVGDQMSNSGTAHMTNSEPHASSFRAMARTCFLAVLIAGEIAIAGPANAGLYDSDATSIKSGQILDRDYWRAKWDSMRLDDAIKERQPEGAILIAVIGQLQLLDDLIKNSPTMRTSRSGRPRPRT